MEIDVIIRQAVAEGADNIHFVTNATPMMRVKGKMKAIGEDLLKPETVESILTVICDSSQLESLASSGELNFGYAITGVGRFRINVLKQRGSYAVSVRIHKLIVPPTHLLGIPRHLIDVLKQRKGLFLVTGPSGCGKSTTMAALLNNWLSGEPQHVITVESPIEYLLRHDQGIVLQRDVGIDCADIHSGLKGAALHDPDVIMLSEIPDEQTLNLALKLAEAGKCVIAGYQASSAIGALERLLVADPSREALRKHQLTSALTGVLAQRLVPRKDADDRVLACELLLINPAIKTHLQHDQLAEIQNSLIAGRKQGMVSLDASLFKLYEEALISRETLMEHAVDKEYIRRLENTYQRERGHVK